MTRGKAATFLMLILATLWAAPVFAATFGTNITISDGVYTGTGWHSNREDQEVEPNCVQTQMWDLEAFYLNGNKLSLVGGFDFKNGGYDSGRHITYKSGDIFLDIDSNAKYGPANTGAAGGEGIVKNTFGYDYVIHFTDLANYKYNVYRIDGTADVQTVYFDQNKTSNPWIWKAGGTKLFDTDQSFAYYSGMANNDANFNGTVLYGGNHNALSIDLGFLNGATFLAHFTEECGNDTIVGTGTPVPEPGTMALLGAGLIGLAGWGRKKFTP